MSSMELPSAGPPSLNLNATVGAILVGGLITAVLYGITLLQTVFYYQHSQRDGWGVKSAVFVLWALDTFDMCLIGHTLYFYMVINYGNPSVLAAPVWSMILHLLVTPMTELVVRTMFTLRVWKLSEGNWASAAIISILGLADLALGTVVTAKSFGKTFAQLSEIEGFVFAEFSTSLAADLLVVLLLCYYLHRSRTGMSGTESLINTLTVYVVETGLLTVIALSINMALFAAKPNNLAFVAIYFTISKLYTNAYLAMLNVRDHIRGKRDEIVPIHRNATEANEQGAIGEDEG
ncbi:hypothetical protein PHLGIDRAFT_122186 [Phlebiopsis gigantea 11061_1 CR5-6]|uniref:DUF6534 domain-containing protein n=1 Tax=Phlebiopsis gigantea (strain 11061_1 CR5-6) TaxID=745531 RepID=A0A0C3S435_PHLG1|nr:hypothetical protein PHLGIDRAFT_122186 [Phlebiopsis gigantea 11061_1 CR5-6]